MGETGGNVIFEESRTKTSIVLLIERGESVYAHAT